MAAGSGRGAIGLMLGISSHLCPVAPLVGGALASRRQGGIQTIPGRRQLRSLDRSPGGGTNWTFPGVQRFLCVFAMGNVQASACFPAQVSSAVARSSWSTGGVSCPRGGYAAQVSGVC